MFQPDQQSAFDLICKAVESKPDVFALFLTGSWGTDQADQWSDIDLLAVVPNPERNWLPDLGELFAEDLQIDERGVLFRLVYSHGLCIDLLNVTPASLENTAGWKRAPFYKGVRPAAGDYERFEPSIARITPAYPRPELNDLRQNLEDMKFIAIQALKKLARGDELIARHLAMEAMQHAMVGAMIVRDLSEDDDVELPEYEAGHTVSSIVCAAADVADALGKRYLDEYNPAGHVIRDYCSVLPARHA